jgi:hypothetical protein
MTTNDSQNSETFSHDEKLTKLKEMAKELDEAHSDRYVIVTEDKCINLFGEEEGKECWKELLSRCPDGPPRVMDPTKIRATPPWSE